jgi:hypothetical protein
LKIVLKNKYSRKGVIMASYGYAGGYHVPKSPKLSFPCVYVLNKPKIIKKYIGGTSRAEM